MAAERVTKRVKGQERALLEPACNDQLCELRHHGDPSRAAGSLRVIVHGCTNSLANDGDLLSRERVSRHRERGGLVPACSRAQGQQLQAVIPAHLGSPEVAALIGEGLAVVVVQ